MLSDIAYIYVLVCASEGTNNLYIIVTVVVLCMYVSVRSFLPPCASRSRNIGTYVFTATRKTF